MDVREVQASKGGKHTGGRQGYQVARVTMEVLVNALGEKNSALRTEGGRVDKKVFTKTFGRFQFNFNSLFCHRRNGTLVLSLGSLVQ